VKRGGPGILIRVGDETFLFDSGPGSLRSLAKAGIFYLEIDRIFYTHFHVDHTLELSLLLFALRNPDYPRTHPLWITAPRGFQKIYDGFHQAYGEWIEPKGYELNIQEIWEETIESDEWKVTSKKVLHTENSLAYRLESKEGKVITYSGDTDYCDNIIHLARDADILILECSFPDERKMEGHLTPSQGGEIATQAHAKKLVLTHFYPICDKYDILKQCRKTFPGEVVLAEDLLRIKV
jgi:ribonuclease BN (tRNA processing enzyme)